MSRSLNLLGVPGLLRSPVVRINSGGSTYIDSQGNTWLADTYFTNGNANNLEAALGAFTVTKTNNQALYKFERARDNVSFSYAIPVVSGVYAFNLHFCESFHQSPGQRLGTVALNGANILTNFDVFTEAGGGKIALIKTFSRQILSNFTLTFTNTLVNGIELFRV